MNSTTLDPQSKIVDFYKNKSIFITGASGFIGKVLVEKLLRTCPTINKIYMLLRSKKGQSTQDRLGQEFINFKLFEHLDKNLIREKLVAFDGNLIADRFGFAEEDIRELCLNVNIVFHVAASVRFDDPIRDCINFNVLATKTIIELCHKMVNLDCFVHVSTAYAHCQLKTLEEKLYPLKASASQIIDALDWMDESTLEKCSEYLMDGRPNTYTFTKAVAEHCVNEFRGQLPVAIARPSIVTASFEEPFPGWVDSFNGPAGASLLGTLGIARSMICTPNFKADLIPIDIVSNALIVIAWKTATDFQNLNNNNYSSTNLIVDSKTESINTLPIYNITSGDVNPTTWEEFLEHGREIAFSMPSEQMIRLPAQAPKGDKVNRFAHTLTKIFSEILFAYMIDAIAILTGRKPKLVKIVRRMHHAYNLLEYFATRQWNFPCDNVLSLYDSLDKTDQQLFNFDVRKVDWRSYMYNLYKGIRRHLLNERDDNVPQALKKMYRLKIGYFMIKVMMSLLFGLAYLKLSFN